MKPPSGFQSETPRLGIQHLNQYAIASTPDPKVLGSNPNYELGQALGPNLSPRVWVTIGSYKISAVSKRDCLPANLVDQSWSWESQIFLREFPLYNTLSVDQASRP